MKTVIKNFVLNLEIKLLKINFITSTYKYMLFISETFTCETNNCTNEEFCLQDSEMEAGFKCKCFTASDIL